MAIVYITMTRTDIPNGLLQIRDLYPNPSDFNAVIDPYPQGPFYLSQPSNSTVYTTSNGDARTISYSVSGLSAYLIATLRGNDLGGGDYEALTATEANTIATNLISRMQNSLALASANITDIANNTQADSSMAAPSTARVADILAILTGAIFTLPAGHQVQDTNGIFTPISVIDIDDYFSGEKNNRVLASDIAVSAAKGALSVMLSDNFTYKGTANNCVAIYNSDGTVYDPNA